MDFWLWAGLAVVVLGGWVVFFGAPYVPSRKREIEQAFSNLYRVSSNDHLVDLGSGDGAVLWQAAKCGARATGFEINPLLVLFTKIRFRYNPNIQVFLRNLWKTDLPQSTTVVYIFGESRSLKKLPQWIEKQMKQRREALYVVSYGFEIPGLQPIRKDRSYLLYQIEPLQT